ncbi:MAG: dephospho-CoA kinase [Candidatus Kryptonium sp.]
MQFKHGILTVGVTGGIGSGKTTVCKIFEELGAKVLYADEIAKKLMEGDKKLKREIEKLFGPNAYIEGKLNRKFISDVIFSNKEKRKALESIVHPAVVRRIVEKFREISKSKNDDFVIVEAALIFESGFDKELDCVVVVDADEELKIKRIMERDNCTREEVLKRMRAQMSQSKKKNLADIVIKNDGGIEALRERVKFLYSLFQKISKLSGKE